MDEDMDDIEQIKKRIVNLEDTLGTLIAWLPRELGVEACKKLLSKLHSAQMPFNSSETEKD